MTRILALALSLAALPAFASDLATGEAIRAAVSGNTVQGGMTDTGAYTEFYAEDGTIKGQGYAGSWTIEGDTMCFRYGEDPAACWNARIEGERIVWIQDGAEKGDGTILKGNPNNF
jgi:hypothetical protein